MAKLNTEVKDTSLREIEVYEYGRGAGALEFSPRKTLVSKKVQGIYNPILGYGYREIGSDFLYFAFRCGYGIEDCLTNIEKIEGFPIWETEMGDEA